MALPPIQTIHVPLAGPLDQKTARLARGMPVLRHCLNGRMDRHGDVRKRRGYTELDTGRTVFEETPEAIFVSLGVDRDGQLVVMGSQHCYGVAASGNVVNGQTLVRRGPSVVGSHRVAVIKVSSLRRPT